MSTGTRPRSGRRQLTSLALAAVVLVAATACTGTWGIRASYRTYVTGFIGQGEITASEGATWLNGPGTGKGPFQWTVASSSFDAGTETGWVQFSGGVSTAAHLSDEGYVLDTSFWNPRLEIEGDEGTLYVDLSFRPFEGTEPEELPALQAQLDVPFATLDLSGEDWTPNSGGMISISDAPTVGITAAMQLIGWDDFYGDPVELDPFSVSFFPESLPTLAATPKIVVSETEELHPGDTVIVYGSGFAPTNVGTRPPLAGQLSGNYAVFGRFADTWKPSAGATGSARTVLGQRWALPEPSFSTMNPSGTDPAYVELGADGTFTALLTVVEGGTTGNYGIYTYGGGGAVNAAQELAVPITFAS